MRSASCALGALHMVLVTAATQVVVAAPALERAIEIRQPDGSRFLAVRRGDEWTNWTETRAGHTVKRGSDGFWYYVRGFKGKTAVLSLLRVGRDTPAGVPAKVRPLDSGPAHASGVSSASSDSLSQAPTGAFTGKVLFILAEFDDRQGTTSESSWASVLKNEISDYFEQASFGKVALVPAQETSGTKDNGVVGWVNVGARHPDTAGSTGTVNRTLTGDAILAADPYIDYAGYDDNGDGFVDADELAVVVIVAGFDRAYDFSSPSVWAHKWSVPGAPTLDGVVVADFHSGAGGYAQFGELHGSHQATIGIIAHELGHLIFGLPDLYDIDGSSEGIGVFGFMGSGNWGERTTDAYAGQTPVLPTAWTLVDRGWAVPAEGSGAESITASGASGASSSNTVRKASTDNSKQYFLVQNRQNRGYDAGLERWLGDGFAGGLNIFHVDESRTGNSDDGRRLVDVEAGDGTPVDSGRGENSDLWYPGNATRFDAFSDPDSNLYGGAASGVEIHSISAPATVVSATFGNGDNSGGAPGDVTLVGPQGVITDNTPTYTWHADPTAAEYKLRVDDASGDKRILIWYTATEAGCADGAGTCSLTPSYRLAEGEGSWKIRPRNADATGDWTAPMSFTLDSGSGGGGVPGTVSLISPQGEVSDSTPTYVWEADPGATRYKLRVDDARGDKRILTWYTAQEASCASGAGTCSLTPSYEVAGGAASWRIRAGTGGETGDWSAEADFSVSSSGGGGLPGKVVLVSPGGVISDDTPRYVWNADPDAKDYKLWVNDANGKHTRRWYSAADAGCATGGGTCSLAPSSRVATGGASWKILTRNDSGKGPWSDAMAFEVR